MNEETPLERWSRQMGEHRHIDFQSAMYTQVELERILKVKNQQIATLNFELKKLKEACAEFRDAVLHQRHQLEEPCLDNDQTNAVLGLFDDTIGQAITGD